MTSHELQFSISNLGLPADVLQMRQRIFRDETEFLSDSELASPDDEIGTHFCLHHQGKLAAAALGVPAEQSSFPSRTSIPPDQLGDCYYATRLMVAPEFRGQGLSALLVYALLREGRILGRKTAVALFTAAEAVPARIAGAVPFRNLPPRSHTGHQGRRLELHPMLTNINYGMHRSWRMLRPTSRQLVEEHLLADEVVRTVLLETERFYENPWLQRVYSRTLTRGQYVDFLANSHLFVRWTTRILARAVSITDDPRLRSHYLHHLSGEIDHERIIERDLTYLGADVEYIRDHMAPCVDIGHFMGMQESLVGFRAEPIALLAVPLAVESLTAHLSGQFLGNLDANIRSWGYEEPARASEYLRSHIPIDGGDDGHWERTRLIVQNFIHTEPETQRFVGIVRMVVVAMTRALASYVAQPDFT